MRRRARACKVRGVQILADPLPSYDMDRAGRGRSSGVEHDLAKVGVVGSNPIARSKYSRPYRKDASSIPGHGNHMATNKTAETELPTGPGRP
jgi:hypothetical protein